MRIESPALAPDITDRVNRILGQVTDGSSAIAPKDFGSNVVEQGALFDYLTSIALAANASFTSVTDDMASCSRRTIVAHAFADQAGDMYIEQSPDNINWDIIETASVSANTGTALIVLVKSRYIRFRYVNGATAQTVFRFAKRYSFA